MAVQNQESGPAKEPVSESGGSDVRTPDPVTGEPSPKKPQTVVDSGAALPEKSAEVGPEGLVLALPQPSGEASAEEEKLKAVANGVGTSGRAKKRVGKFPKLIPNVAWGKLLSQCSQVVF